MTFLLDPNVAFLLLVLGIVFGILALFTPGTGFLEIGAVFAIALAAYALYNLPTNLWALLIILVGIVPFVVAVRKSRNWIWLIPSVACFIVGSVFLFRSVSGSPTINPFFATVLSILSTLLLWFVGRKGIDVMRQKPVQDLGKLIGMTGEAVTDINKEGTVYVNGENWSARSKQEIPAGSSVKVLKRDGLVLTVEVADSEESGG